jgi:methylglutaconyl-CoA hydratase
VDEPVDLTLDARGVAVLTLNRPQRHNALSEEMLRALTATATRLGRDPAVRVVVLTGAGGSFCAGGDLAWMQHQMAAPIADRTAAAMLLAEMLSTLNTLPKPLIGKINGNSFGGALGLIAVCDVAIAAQTARFGLTEVRLGLIPATIGPYVAARMGAKARRVFFSGRVFDAAEAVALDLVARAVPPDALDAAVEGEVAPFLSCAPGAVAAGKALLRQLSVPPDAAQIAMTVDALTARWEDPEAEAGIGAFLAKSKPPWAG